MSDDIAVVPPEIVHGHSVEMAGIELDKALTEGDESPRPSRRRESSSAPSMNAWRRRWFRRARRSGYAATVWRVRTFTQSSVAGLSRQTARRRPCPTALGPLRYRPGPR